MSRFGQTNDRSWTGGRLDRDFPPLNPNPSGAASGDDDATIHPYRLFADKLVSPTIVLRPPCAAESEGPASDSDNLFTLLASLNQSLRLLSAPWNVQGPDSESFHLANGIEVPTEADGEFHPVVTITVPPGRNGVLNLIANEFVGAGFVDFSGALIWQLQRNPASNITSAERNYQQILATLGTPAVPGKIAGIRIFENDVIVLAVQNVSVGVAGQQCGGLLGGWFYPRTQDDEYEHSLRRRGRVTW